MNDGRFVAELNIADVRFRVTSALPLDSAPSSGPYASFLGPGKVNGQAVNVDIQVRCGEVPSTSNLQQVFADHSWALYRDTDSYQLEFRSRLPGQPLWAARFGEDAQEIAVFASSQMVQETERGPRILSPLCYPLDQLLWVYALARRGGLLLHAAGATLGNAAFLFPGPGGAGKTTLSRLLDRRQGFLVLSDDRTAVRCDDGSYSAYGTPWPGEARMARNSGAPLKAMMFLVQSKCSGITPLSPEQAMRKLIPVVSLPWYNKRVIEPMLDQCEHLVSTVPAFDLQFAPEVEVVDLLHEYAHAF